YAVGDDKIPGPINSLGQSWWLLVIGSGPLRDAGYALVARMAAKSRAGGGTPVRWIFGIERGDSQHPPKAVKTQTYRRPPRRHSMPTLGAPDTWPSRQPGVYDYKLRHSQRPERTRFPVSASIINKSRGAEPLSLIHKKFSIWDFDAVAFPPESLPGHEISCQV